MIRYDIIKKSFCAYLRTKVEVELCAFLTPAVASRPGRLAP